jgi:hypothetical protein
MAIAFVSESNTQTASMNNTTPNTVTAPAGIVDGYVLVALANRETDVGTLSLPTGFTELDSDTYTGGGTARQVVLGWKYASSESGNYDFTTDDTNAQTRNHALIAVYSGVIGTNPLDVTYVNATHAIESINDGTPTAQPITTETDGASVLLLLSAHITAGTVPQEGVTGYAEDSWGLSSNSTNGKYGQVLRKSIPTAATETPAAWNSFSVGGMDSWAATIALKPAADSPSSLTINIPGISIRAA